MTNRRMTIARVAVRTVSAARAVRDPPGRAPDRRQEPGGDVRHRSTDTEAVSAPTPARS